jgi:hypothetical protein
VLFKTCNSTSPSARITQVVEVFVVCPLLNVVVLMSHPKGPQDEAGRVVAVRVVVETEAVTRWLEEPMKYPTPALAITRRITKAATTSFLMLQIAGSARFTPTPENGPAILMVSDKDSEGKIGR